MKIAKHPKPCTNNISLHFRFKDIILQRKALFLPYLAFQCLTMDPLLSSAPNHFLIANRLSPCLLEMITFW